MSKFLPCDVQYPAADVVKWLTPRVEKLADELEADRVFRCKVNSRLQTLGITKRSWFLQFLGFEEYYSYYSSDFLKTEYFKGVSEEYTKLDAIIRCAKTSDGHIAVSDWETKQEIDWAKSDYERNNQKPVKKK